MRFDEDGDASIALEVAVDVGARGLLVDAELRGEAEGRDAVDDAEVDGLGAGAGLFAHGGGVDLEDLGGGEGVDVFAGAVGVEEERVLREVRHEAELDLRVVGGHEQVAGRGDEGGADFAADGGADGDVLQVGVRGREAAGGGADLVEGGVDAAVGVGEQWERVEVGAFELLELAVLDDSARRWGSSTARSSRTSCAVETTLPLPYLMRLGEVHLVEEDVAELLGRVDVEAVAR